QEPTESAPSVAKRRITIAAMDAVGAFRKLGEQTGVQIMAPSVDMRGVHTTAVDGEYTPAEAARLMPAVTKLEVIEPSPDVISIRQAEAAPATSSASEAELTTVDEVIVTGSRLRRTSFDTLQPSSVTSSDEIRLRAISNVA